MENTELDVLYAVIFGAVLSLVGMGAGLMEGISIGHDLREMTVFGFAFGLGAAALGGTVGVIVGRKIGSLVQLLRLSA